MAVIFLDLSVIREPEFIFAKRLKNNNKINILVYSENIFLFFASTS